MKKSLATFARIHWKDEYEDYLSEKKCNKRSRQVIKAEQMLGKKYTFSDWCKEQEDFNSRECQLAWCDTIPRECYEY